MASIVCHCSALTLRSTLFLLLLLPQALAQADNSPHPKRGLVDTFSHSNGDTGLFTSPQSDLTWYYNYYYRPSLRSSMEYVPMIHGVGDLENAVSSIRNLDGITYVLTFNEPDATPEVGGSLVSAPDAAQAYINSILPLRERGLKIGLPATTGSGPGLDWLSTFNESCYNISATGCPADFAAVHWYGDFVGMASHLGRFHELWPSLPIWLTELGVPSAPLATTEQIFNQSIEYLDGLDYVARYSWFGSTRPQWTNNFTGPNNTLLNDDGQLTQIGATYLGGEAEGFREGQTSDASRPGNRPGRPGSGAGALGSLSGLGLYIVLSGLVIWLLI